jgi:hypothetical protein
MVWKRSQSLVTFGSRYGGERTSWVSEVKFCAGDAALPDDRKECADGELRWSGTGTVTVPASVLCCITT